MHSLCSRATLQLTTPTGLRLTNCLHSDSTPQPNHKFWMNCLPTKLNDMKGKQDGDTKELSKPVDSIAELYPLPILSSRNEAIQRRFLKRTVRESECVLHDSKQSTNTQSIMAMLTPYFSKFRQLKGITNQILKIILDEYYR